GARHGGARNPAARRQTAPAGRFAAARRAAGDAGRRDRAVEASAARAGGLPDRAPEDPRARAGHEAGARRAGVRRLEADFLLHGRRPRRLPGTRARARRGIQDADRDAANRRPRRSEDVRRLRHLRTPALLHHLPAVVRAGLDQDGEAAGPEPQPVEAVGVVRTLEVLPALRAAQRQGRRARRLRQRRRLRQPVGLRLRRLRLRQLRHVRPSIVGSRNTRHRMKPRIAITSGDPAGIGPEVAARAAADPRVLAACEPVVYGPAGGATFDPGVLSAEAGRAAYDVIVRAVSDARAGAVDAVATAPVNKEAFRLAGLPWAGHTDLLAHLTGSKHVAMMFHSEALRVVLATVHVALSEVPRALTRASLEATIDLTAREL